MASQSRVQIRLLAASDVAALVPLLEAYMKETYRAPWSGSAEALHRDASGQKCTICIALAEDESLVGFLAWVPSYDLHHCVAGAEALDMYVVPRWRGRGIALLLGCAAAAEIARRGGRYLKGSTVESGAGRRLYRRFGVCDAAGCIVSGRAFRRLAELAGRSAREVVGLLPERSWNYEAGGGTDAAPRRWFLAEPYSGRGGIAAHCGCDQVFVPLVFGSRIASPLPA